MLLGTLFVHMLVLAINAASLMDLSFDCGHKLGWCGWIYSLPPVGERAVRACGGTSGIASVQMGKIGDKKSPRVFCFATGKLGLIQFTDLGNIDLHLSAGFELI